MLRQIRNNRGLQRKFVASKLKITPDHLSKIERGACTLTVENAQKMSMLYEVEINEIINAYKEEKEKCQINC